MTTSAHALGPVSKGCANRCLEGSVFALLSARARGSALHTSNVLCMGTVVMNVADDPTTFSVPVYPLFPLPARGPIPESRSLRHYDRLLRSDGPLSGSSKASKPGQCLNWGATYQGRLRTYQSLKIDTSKFEFSSTKKTGVKNYRVCKAHHVYPLAQETRTGTVKFNITITAHDSSTPAGVIQMDHWRVKCPPVLMSRLGTRQFRGEHVQMND
ncbi:hypothetical protein BJ138DRAFT_1184250 [Hygrophoropsis aurantiaca]|uniref:Uncharacterized protein n=1 Tax=Hygrophoropsis aurantiaca TaxID=72124 RepID=A0ACB7ZSG7_9AGAM|nr:hypothetical protein BJ138DRAFT_1184250 [Hygrophoropsis aurantiaca]